MSYNNCFTSLVITLIITHTLFGQELTTNNIQIPGTDVTFEMVQVPAGQLSVEGLDQPYELPSFWIGAKEVTYEEYRVFEDKSFDADTSLLKVDYKVDAVTRPTPPYLDYTYGMGRHGGFPAVSMTQQAALRYCKWLYEKTGIFFRLPTEAEWEYACRAGTSTTYYFGDDPEDLDDHAWYWDNSGEKYHATGTKKPNPWGLYDMSGNVSEWMLDQYVDDFASVLQSEDGWAPPSGKYGRTVRGGAYDDDAATCGCGNRVRSNPKWQARDPQVPKSIWWNPDAPFVGFRIVRPIGDFSEDYIEEFFKRAIKD